ncbi:MAG: DUF1761 domain-containing protein [Saprospiraceae bacterium]|jgi:hypothetical protein|nr:DUF1761 domain-containing protein [Saprospiraceae bacterium]
MEEMHVNWLAVVVSAIVPMVVGFLYYHPKVLGGVWMKANGFTLESIGTGPKPILFGVALLLSFMLSLWMAANVTGPGQDVAPDGHSYATFGHGVVHGLIHSVMFLLPILGTQSVFEKRGWAWVFVNLGYWAVTLSVMGGILSMWR